MYMNPLLTWSRFALQAGETALGSAQVIAYRTNPTAERGEMLTMGREKGEAAIESMQAMGLPLMRMYQQMAALGFSQMMSLWSSMLSIGSSRTSAQVTQRQLKLLDDTIKSSAVAASKAARSGAAVARSALEPVQRRVKANVTRLSKKKVAKKNVAKKKPTKNRS